MATFQGAVDSSANWAASNRVPLLDEYCFENDTNKLKIGDGVTPYNTLPYVNPGVVLSGPIMIAGSGLPDAGDGVDGDYYLDTATNFLYGPKIGGVWGSTPTATFVSVGDAANVVLMGAAAPTSGDGVNNDGWLDASAHATTGLLDFYPPKTGGVWTAPASVPVADALGNVVDAYAGNRIATGCTTWPRWNSSGNTVSLPSGTVRFTFFTCPESFTAATLTAYAGATAAAGTTYAALGLYSVANTGVLTLLSSTTSDTTLFSGADGTAYQKTLGSTVALAYGARYAVGCLVVAPTTAPTTRGQASSVFDQTTLPYVGASLAGQSTLPSTVTFASQVGSTSTQYVKILP